MRRREITGLLSVSVIIAFAAGAGSAAWNVTSHNYLKYGLYRLAALSFSGWITKAVIMAFGAVIICCIGWFLGRRVWNSFFSRAAETKERGRNSGRVWAAYVLSYLFFICLGAASNQYWISYRWYHPVSLTYDAGLLVFAVALGRLLSRFPIENMFGVLYGKKVRWAAIAVVASVLILNAGIYIDARMNPPQGPDIIVITIETLRADHLGCYGYERNTSPTIDAVAGEGVQFSNMFAQRALTWPSLTSIMTSLYPVNHGVRHNGHLLYPSVVSLAEILKNNGYRCGAFLAHGVGAGWRGFDRLVEAAYQDEKITRDAIEWLRIHRGEKLFLWIHYFEPHKPYQPPQPYRDFFDPDYKGIMNGSAEQLDEIALNKIDLEEDDLNHIVSLYDGSILATDNQVKKVLDTLRELGLEEKSLIVISADHGEDLYQHNHYFYHTASIYDSSLHIPFVVKYPRKDFRNKVVEEVVESIDIAPTILELANIPEPKQFEGSSLTPLMRAEGPGVDFGYAFSEWQDKILSVRSEGHRYIFNPREYHPRSIEGATEDTYPIEREELYDVVKDAAESENIVADERETAERLMGKMLEWENFTSWAGGNGASVREAPEHVREQLRALGYI